MSFCTKKLPCGVGIKWNICMIMTFERSNQISNQSQHAWAKHFKIMHLLLYTYIHTYIHTYIYIYISHTKFQHDKCIACNTNFALVINKITQFLWTPTSFLFLIQFLTISGGGDSNFGSPHKKDQIISLTYKTLDPELV